MDYIDRLRALREDNDLTQTEVADHLGTSQTMYARYERRASELPIRHLIKLCALYNISADYKRGRKAMHDLFDVILRILDKADADEAAVIAIKAVQEFFDNLIK